MSFLKDLIESAFPVAFAEEVCIWPRMAVAGEWATVRNDEMKNRRDLLDGYQRVEELDETC